MPISESLDLPGSDVYVPNGPRPSRAAVGITLPGGERVSSGVLDVNNVEGSGMTLAVDDGANTTNVTAAGDHCKVSSVELDEVGDLAGVDIKNDGVIDLKNVSSKYESLKNYISTAFTNPNYVRP